MLKDEMFNFRAKERLSMEKAARSAGVSLQTWYSVEAGHQTPHKMTEAKIRLLIGGAKDNESVN